MKQQDLDNVIGFIDDNDLWDLFDFEERDKEITEEKV